MDELKRPSGRKVLAMLMVICMCMGLLPGNTVTVAAKIVETHYVYFNYPDDINDGAYEEYQVEDGQCISAPTENIENENRKILGWTTERYGTEPYDFSQPVTGYLDLYPIMSAYSVRFSNMKKTVYVEAGKTVTPPTISATSAYGAEFKHWYEVDKDENQPFDFTQPINRDYVLEIKWKQYEVNINYPSDFKDYFRENDIAWQSNYTLIDGEKVEQPKAETLDNGIRKISGWTTDYKTTYDFNQPVTEDLELYPIMDKYIVYFEDHRTDDEFQEYVTAGQTVSEPEYEKANGELEKFDGWRDETDELSEYEEADFIDLYAKVDLTQPINRDYYLVSGYVNNYSCYIDVYRTLTGGDRLEIERIYIRNGTSRKDAVLAEYPIPERFGYTFTGWYYDKACTVECKQGEKLNPEYFYGEDEYYDTSLATKLYAGWIKNDTREKVEYCEITLRSADDWEWESFYVEKGSVLGEQQLPDVWNHYGENYIMKYYQDDNLTEPFDKNKVISGDTTIYIDNEYDERGLSRTLNSYNGSKPYEGIYEKPEREGYTFTGWYYDKDCTYNWHEGTWYQDWAYGKLYAGWQKGGNGVVDYSKPNIGYYALNFNYNYEGYYKDSKIEDGEWRNQGIYKYYYCGRNNFNCNNIYIEKGDSAAAYKDTLGDPVIPGHYFMGWYTDKACTVPFDFNTVLTGDTVVYGKWGTNAEQSCITPQNGTQVNPEQPGNTTTNPTPEQPGNTTTNPTPTPEQPGNTTTNPTPTPEQPGNTTTNPTPTPEQPGNTTTNPTPTPEQPGNTATTPVTTPKAVLNVYSTVLKVGTSSGAVKIIEKHPANDTVESYKSSNTKIVTVDKKGKITAGKKTGTATITITMKSGATVSYKVKVQKKKVTTKKLLLSEKKLSLKKGGKTTLQVNRVPITAIEKITWSTSDKKIAMVNKKGKVSAKKKGKAIITARTSNGKKATCVITVK